MSESEALRQRFEAAMMVNYGTPPLALARGEGSRVWDADGNRYLDLIAGIAVSALGHAHPAIVDAVTAQVGRIAHTSNLFVHEPEVQLAEKLLALLHADAHGGARVFFCNSGTEANEAALKLVRRQQGAGRPVIVAADHSFHGRTMGALAITGKESIRAPFAPFGFDVRWVEYGDAAALGAAVDERTAAVVLEPTQGEGGVIPAPAGVPGRRPRGLRPGRRAAGARRDPVRHRPHRRVVRAPGRGGHPRRAHAGQGPRRRAADRRLRRLRRQRHRPAGGRPRLDLRRQPDRLRRRPRRPRHDRARRPARERQARGRGRSPDGIEAIDHPVLKGVRGSGLWLAAVLNGDQAAAVTTAARQAGFLVNAVQPDAVRLAPPLILTETEADEFTTALPAILTHAQEG